ncbi:MAG TPA: GGDEF domain-containing protein, partial [Pseudomonadales bacterium]|nr:GGDEF domain-containing protein [Pseudomonadales bacterium]
GLTQLYNRRHWESRFSEEFKRVKRYGGQLALIMFDLDHFKSINDTRGHLGGDEVLKSVAALIKRQVREYDIPGRYGGEEFGIVLPNTDDNGAAHLAERIRAAVQNEVIEWEGQTIPVTVSLGITGMSDALESHSDMIAQADEALYKSKKTGRNKWTKYADI